MDSATLSDYLLQSVIWFSGAALVLMLWLLAAIAWLRMRLIAGRAREQQFLDVWQPLLAAAIAGERDELPPLAKEDHTLFMRLFNHLHGTLRGNARKRLNIIALRLGMLQHAYALLQNKSLGAKLLALSTLGNLGDRHDWQTMLALARHRDPLLSLAAARALFQVDGDAALHDLRQQLLERHDWPTTQLTMLLQESGTPAIFGALADRALALAASSAPEANTQLNRLLHLLAAAPYQQAIPAIRAVLATTQDGEAVAQCLKFLREPGDLQFVRARVADPNWVVRLQAAHALGRCGVQQDLRSLTTLLGDPVWWVRYRAAQALMALTHGDARAISELRTGLDDLYARDMLDMVIAEQEAQ